MIGARAIKQKNLSGDDAVDEFSVHVGQAVVTSLLTERQPSMIDTHEVQHRRVQIMHFDGILDDVVGVVVGGAVAHTRLDATSRKPD